MVANDGVSSYVWNGCDGWHGKYSNGSSSHLSISIAAGITTNKL
jgi:hypothetical protein